MISIVYSATTSRDVQDRLGEAEYSYYFVLKEFMPLLETFGSVVIVTDPAREVDPIFRESRNRGEECFFFSFAPPHMTTLGLDCPTIPVFAWEYDTIPNETWLGERQQDWRYVFDQVGRAITHSNASARLVKDAMGWDFPVASIPAPLWDRFALRSERRSRSIATTTTPIEVSGQVIDSRMVNLSRYAPECFGKHEATLDFPLVANPQQESQSVLDGVIYLSVFNPGDGRKNWPDLVAGFCHCFRDVSDATLILKLTHHQRELQLAQVLEWLYKFSPFQCRVLLVTGFLEADQYEALIESASYVVNASHGEGQCLPLMEGMARGKPAVAPRHSAMADYIDTPQAFVVRSSGEPSRWPHDAREAYRILRQRIDFDSLVEAYRQSYEVAKKDPARYARMSENARDILRRHASVAIAREELMAFLKTPSRAPSPDNLYGHVGAPWNDFPPIP